MPFCCAMPSSSGPPIRAYDLHLSKQYDCGRIRATYAFVSQDCFCCYTCCGLAASGVNSSGTIPGVNAPPELERQKIPEEEENQTDQVVVS